MRSFSLIVAALAASISAYRILPAQAGLTLLSLALYHASEVSSFTLLPVVQLETSDSDTGITEKAGFDKRQADNATAATITQAQITITKTVTATATPNTAAQETQTPAAASNVTEFGTASRANTTKTDGTGRAASINGTQAGTDRREGRHRNGNKNAGSDEESNGANVRGSNGNNRNNANNSGKNGDSTAGVDDKNRNGNATAAAAASAANSKPCPSKSAGVTDTSNGGINSNSAQRTNVSEQVGANASSNGAQPQQPGPAAGGQGTLPSGFPPAPPRPGQGAARLMRRGLRYSG